MEQTNCECGGRGTIGGHCGECGVFLDPEEYVTCPTCRAGFVVCGVCDQCREPFDVNLLQPLRTYEKTQ